MEEETEIKEQEFLRLLKRNSAPFDYEKQLFNDHFPRVVSALNGEHPSPYEIEIQPTSKCNLRCIHCFGTALTCERIPDKMGQKEFETIAQRIKDFKLGEHTVETVKFCGTTGEPLVNPATAQNIKLFKDLGKKVIFYTNGLWLNRTTPEGKEYLDYVLDADKINLSLDAGSRETFINIKGVDGFDRIIDNLRRLVRKRDEEGSNLRIDVSYVIGSHNYKEIFLAAETAKDAGADNIIFRVDFANPDSVKPFIEEIKEQRLQTMKLKSDYFGISFAYSDEDLSTSGEKTTSPFYSRGKKCYNHHFWACIGSDCNLYVCGHRTYNGVDSFGSVLDNSLEDLWLKKERLEKVEKLPDDKCKFCSPSCHRRDCLMKFLTGLEIGDVKYLHKKFIEKVPCVIPTSTIG